MSAALVAADLARIVTAADVQISADARTVAYRRDRFDLSADRLRSAIHVIRAERDEQWSCGTRDTMPRLHHDGEHVAYVAHGGNGDAGGAQLCIGTVGGSPAVALGPRYARITGVAWSPDGRQIALTAAAPADPERSNVYRDAATGAMHIRALPYKTDGDGLFDGTLIQLYVIACSDGTARQLTHGVADAAAPAWSPDGRSIAFACRSDARETSTCAAIFVVEIDGESVRQITAGDGAAGTPAFSPDGTRIAYVGHRHASDYRFGHELLVSDLAGGTTRSLSAADDRPVGNLLCGDLRSGAPIAPCWSHDGTEILAVVTDGGTSSLRAYDAHTGATRIVAGGERDIASFACAAGGTLAFAYATPVEPGIVALLTPAGDETAITSLNPWLAHKHVARPQKLRAYGTDGAALDAWFVSAATSTAAAAPIAIDLHPGPHAAFGATFSLLTQVLAAAGVSVVSGNPRGSQGYGEDFTLAITGRWGELDCSDALAIVDAACDAVGDAATPIGCIGQSYGGFLVTSLLAKYPERFAAGVSLDAANELATLAATSDVGGTIAAEFGLTSGVDANRVLFERSPLRAAERIVAPLLIVHGDRDYRCPIDQGEALFNTLRSLGRSNVEFVRFAGEGHELSRSGRPRQRILRMRAVARWLLAHLGVAPAFATGNAGILFAALPGEAALDAEPPAR